MSDGLRVAVVGATGLVGQEMLTVLEEFRFPIADLLPVASSASVGKRVAFQGKEWPVIGLEAAVKAQPELALFSAGSTVSREWAPRFVEAGALVIDNSSAWRMDPEVPLVVPEINLSEVGSARLIANPNCSTIQMVMVLAPLHRQFGLSRVVVSTYQSVSGTGKAAVDQLFGERNGERIKPVYPQQIDLNCLPHCDVFLENGYTKEEMKLVHETRKILGTPELAVTATAVRVPVIGGHSESVNVSLERDFQLDEIRHLLVEMPGVVVQDNPVSHEYPTPFMAHRKNEVFVGRIRRDESAPRSLNLWIVADNLRKGAATNAVQIAQGMLVNA